jgi:hypothetical protein
MAAVTKNRKFGKNHLKIIFSEINWAQNYGGMVFRWSSLRIVSDDPGRQPRQPPLLRIENLTKDHLTIISSEITGPIGPKLWWNGL